MKNVKTITYHQEGDYQIPDYQIPDLILLDNDTYQIGKYGYLRLDYLKKHKRGLYTQLVMECKLNKHLFDTDQEVNNRLNTIIHQLAKKENIRLYPDGNNPLEWTQKMNNIKNRAEEIVLKKLIYC